MARAKKETQKTAAEPKDSNVETTSVGMGPLRPYRKTSPSKQLAASRRLSPKRDGIWLGTLTALAVVTRLFHLSQPTSVVFDEVHFGGFARKYIIGRFFMDVHPPLAKMLYAAFGYLAGYDGEFDFSQIGMEYNDVPYVAMRMLPATMGILTIMLAYSTLRASGCKPSISFFGGFILTLDNAFATQSRFILLDSPLLFFIAITAYGFKKFENEVPFTKDWFRYLFLTGLGLGATVSSKWVGLFTIGWVGLLTLYQLWWLIGDIEISIRNFVKHFLFRALCLIAVPLSFYVAMFALHFVCVVNTGDGASFMPAEFQAHLQHSDAPTNIPVDVLIGSEVTIRHLNTQGGYLHSHEHMYETGSRQQQITLYPHKDENNVWVIEPLEFDSSDNETETVNGFKYLTNGAIVRLRHKSTERRLHSHDHRPPVSEQEHNNEVSAYGFEGFEGDANDNFRVEIVESYTESGPARERVQALKTKFKLTHTTTGCTLFSHNVKLPKWAFEQQEVTCIASGKLPNSIWYIEENSHEALGPDAEVTSYPKMSFWNKFITLNKVMWNINAGLTDSHTWESRPESWPLMKRGINFWVKNARQIYLLGNAVSWLSITALIALYVVYKVIWILLWQRGVELLKNDVDYSIFDSGFGSYLLGWALHYFPSFLMARQLFLHHYLGSVYFGILGLAQFWQFLTARIIRNKIVSTLISAIFMFSVAGFYVWYSPLIYATPWTRELCEKSKFQDMDFDCVSFHEKYEDYKLIPSQVEDTSTVFSTIADEPIPTPEAEAIEEEVVTMFSADNKRVVREEYVYSRKDNEQDEDNDEDEEEPSAYAGYIEIPIPSTIYEEEEEILYDYVAEPVESEDAEPETAALEEDD